MPRITLAEELTYLTDSISSLEVSATSLKECFKLLFARYPQLYVFLVDNHCKESQRILLILNDTELLEYTDISIPLKDTDEICILYSVPYGQGKAIVTALEFAINYAFSETVSQVLAAAVNYAIIMAVSYAVGAIIGALVSDVSNPESTIASTSVNYTFDGIKNSTASGTPINIIYGTHRTGGHILNMFTEQITVPLTSAGTNNAPYMNHTYLLYQIGVSEGEVEEIVVDEIQINRLPRAYFNAVTFSTRNGIRDQDPMDDFNRVINTTTMNRKILWVPTITPAVPLNIAATQVYGAVYKGEVVTGPRVWVDLDPPIAPTLPELI